MDEDESLLNVIYHYQSALERYIKNGHNESKESKMLHCLSKLNKLPIKLAHLEKTGVGRTVNSLRKVDGEVGNAAKALVSKWKEIVVLEEKSTENDDIENKSEKYSDNVKTTSLNNSVEKKVKSEKSRNYSDDNKKHDSSHKTNHSESKHIKSGSREDSKRKRKSESEDDEEIRSKYAKYPSKPVNEDDSSDSENENKTKQKNVKIREKSSNKSSENDYDKKDSSSKHKKHKKHKRNHSDEEDRHKKKHDKQSSEKHKSKETKTIKDDVKIESRSEKKDSKSSSSSKTKKEKSGTSETKKTKEPHVSKSKNRTSNIVIESGSGTSFAEALGMCEPKIRNSKKKGPQVVREPVKEYSSSEAEQDDNDLIAQPDLLKEAKLEPLDINLSSLLPPITPNYKPLGFPVADSPQKRVLTDDEALSRVMSNKNQRTKVFSGNKTYWTKVPSLYDLCIRLLQDNIDAIEYTGGVPYIILKPILEKANSNQLFMLEQYNPYLMEDSDELWKFHCDREFKNKKREEMETWRDMYMRCLDEREAKLKALTANIKLSQDKSLPVRTTKLAYVDTVAKPPRNIARKQAKNDTVTNGRPNLSAKLATIATAGEAGKVAVPNPGHRAKDRATTAGSSHTIAHKPKKAPLMMKTLSLFKSRFRR